MLTSIVPPVNFKESQTGYTYAGAFFGGVLGFILSGFLSDWSAKFLTRLNRGVYEPEFRIVLVIPQMIFGCLGLYGFGFTVANLEKYDVKWPIFFFALEYVEPSICYTLLSHIYYVFLHQY